MTREEYEKRKQEALKDRKQSRFTATIGSFTITKPAKEENNKQDK